jgi:hypothetical protein
VKIGGSQMNKKFEEWHVWEASIDFEETKEKVERAASISEILAILSGKS